MAGVQEENRLRIALVLLGLGMLLIVGGIVLGIQQYQALQSSSHGPVSAQATAVHLDRGSQAKLIRNVLFLLVILTVVLVVSLYAFRQWSRRFRQFLLRKPPPPTPSEDAWAMHRLPEDSVAASEEPSPEPEEKSKEPPPDSEGRRDT
jgi:hypothetical protein